MKIIVNGSAEEISGASELSAVLRNLDIDISKTLVSLNGEVVEREKICIVLLNDGDMIEFFSFVGGG